MLFLEQTDPNPVFFHKKKKDKAQKTEQKQPRIKAEADVVLFTSNIYLFIYFTDCPPIPSIKNKSS